MIFNREGLLLDNADGVYLTGFISVFNKLFACHMMPVVIMTGTGDGHYLENIADISQIDTY